MASLPTRPSSTSLVEGWTTHSMLIEDPLVIEILDTLDTKATLQPQPSMEVNQSRWLPVILSQRKLALTNRHRNLWALTLDLQTIPTSNLKPFMVQTTTHLMHDHQQHNSQRHHPDVIPRKMSTSLSHPRLRLNKITGTILAPCMVR